MIIYHGNILGTAVHCVMQYIELSADDGSNSTKRVRHGRGVHKEKGCEYNGEFKHDEMHGCGTLSFPSGASYSGQFVNNMFDGTGQYTFPSGEVYDGEFSANAFHGTGVITDADGNQWRGIFHNNSGPHLQKLL